MNADFPPPETPGLSEDVVVVVLMVAATAAAEAACIDDMPSIGNDVSEEKCEEFYKFGRKVRRILQIRKECV